MDIKHIKEPLLKNTPFLSVKGKIQVIIAISLGNLLEWYEIYLYVYWAPTFAKIFFNPTSNITNLTHTYLIFALGFLARPLGGLFFGKIGDHLGRKKSMILSVMIMTFPTVIIGILPTYAQIGYFAPIILTIMRFLQAFPAGVEIPGAGCYLYESSEPHKRRFMCSWGSVGFQLGILISILECYTLEKFLNPEALITWGWRFSFLFGGLIGVCSLYLRHKLHETPLFEEAKIHKKVIQTNLFQVLNKYKKPICMGVAFSLLNSASFYWLSINFSTYFMNVFGISYKNNLIITSILILFITIPLPFFGMIADRLDTQKMLIYSTMGSILLLYPLSLSINHTSIIGTTITISMFCLLFTITSALIPYVMSDIFPTYVRFTCSALSFNLADVLIGGFTPTISLLLVNYTGNKTSFCWFLLLCGVISLIAFYKIPKTKFIKH